MADSLFSNNQIDVDALPAIQDVPLDGVSARYRAVNLCVCASVTGLLLVAMGLIYYQPFIKLPHDISVLLPFIMLATGIVGSTRFIYHLAADPKVRFALRENDLLLQQGLFFCSLVCQPVLRIQHVELTRSLLQRWAGLASLKVYSAGGAAHTFEIPGLELGTAKQLKHFIVHHNAFDAK